MTAQFNHQIRSEIIKARNAFPEVVSPMHTGEVLEQLTRLLALPLESLPAEVLRILLRLSLLRCEVHEVTFPFV